MKSACVGVLSIIVLKNARWNIEVSTVFVITVTKPQELESSEYFKVVTFLKNLQRLPI